MNASDLPVLAANPKWVAQHSRRDAAPLIRYTLNAQACARCVWCARVVVDKPSVFRTTKAIVCNKFCRSALLQLLNTGVPQPNNPKTKGKTWKCKGSPSSGALKKGQWAGDKHARWQPRIMVPCNWCGDNIAKARYNIRPGRDYYCVDKGCYIAYRRSLIGARNASFKGGHKEYRGARWPEQRLAAVLRDGGCCQRCKKTVGEKIDVHHIVPYRFCKEHKEANELENLICLCNKCHKLVEWQTWRLFEDLNLFGMKQKTPRKQMPAERL